MQHLASLLTYYAEINFEHKSVYNGKMKWRVVSQIVLLLLVCIYGVTAKGKPVFTQSSYSGSLAMLYQNYTGHVIAKVHAVDPTGKDVKYHIANVTYEKPTHKTVTPDRLVATVWPQNDSNDCMDNALNESFPQNKFCIDFNTGNVFATSAYFNDPLAVENANFTLKIIATSTVGTSEVLLVLQLNPLCSYFYEYNKNELERKCDYGIIATRGSYGSLSNTTIHLSTPPSVMVFAIGIQLESPWIASFPERVDFTLSANDGQTRGGHTVYNTPPWSSQDLRIVYFSDSVYVGDLTAGDNTFTLSAKSSSKHDIQLFASNVQLYSVSLASRPNFCENARCIKEVEDFNNTLKADKFGRCFYELTNFMQYRFGTCKDFPPPRIINDFSTTIQLKQPIAHDTMITKVQGKDIHGNHVFYTLTSYSHLNNVHPSKTFFGFDCVSKAQGFCIENSTGVIRVRGLNPEFYDGRMITLTIKVSSGGKYYRSTTTSLSVIVVDNCSPITDHLNTMAKENCFHNLTYLSPASYKGSGYFNLINTDVLLFVKLKDVPIPLTSHQLNISVFIMSSFQVWWRVVPLSRSNSTNLTGTFQINFQFYPAESIILNYQIKLLNGDWKRLNVEDDKAEIATYQSIRQCDSEKCLDSAKALQIMRYRFSTQEWLRCTRRANSSVQDSHKLDAALSCLAGPAILSNPVNITATLSNKTRLNVVRLQCGYVARSTVNITWWKNGELVDTTKLYRPPFLKLYNYLVFKPINSNEQGYYQCQVESRGHTARSNIAFVYYKDVSTSHAHLRITNETFIPEMLKLSSKAVIDLEEKLSLHLPLAIKKSLGLDGHAGLFSIKRVRSGSVIVDGYLYFHSINSSVSKEVIFNQIGKYHPQVKNMNIDWNKSRIVSYDFCPPVKSNGEDLKGAFHWPATAVSTLKSIPCNFYNKASGIRYASRECYADYTMRPIWGPANDTNCHYKSITTQNLDELSKVNVTESNVEVVIEELHNITSNSSMITNALDVQFTADVFDNIESVGVTKELDIEKLIDVMSSIVAGNNTVVAKSQQYFNSSARILSSAQAIVNKFPFPNTNKGHVYSYNADNAAFAVTFIDRQETTGLTIGYQNNSYWFSNGTSDSNSIGESTIYLPLSLIQRAISQSSTSLQRVTSFSYPIGTLFNSSFERRGSKLLSRILSASVGDHQLEDLVDPVMLTFKQQRSDGPSDPVSCVFWDFTLKGGSGGWSSRGCHVIKTVGMVSTCHCDHLTNFAILLDVTNPSSSTQSSHILDVVTYTGLGISIVCLSLTLLTFSLFKKLRRSLPPRILMSLCVALLGLYITFVLGINRTSSLLQCRTVGILIHYFILATFFWMATEAFNLYLCFVKVMGYYAPKFMLKASIVCWGVPAFMVSICAVSNIKNYGNRNNCMVSNATFYGAVLAPIVIILVSNSIVLLFVIRGINRGPSVGKTKRYKLKSQVRVAFGCCTLLGLSWVFGIFAVGELKMVFQWLFCVTTSLQGLCIFAFYCVRNSDVRKEWMAVVGMGSSKEKYSGTSSSTPSKEKLFGNRKFSEKQNDEVVLTQARLASEN